MIKLSRVLLFFLTMCKFLQIVRRIFPYKIASEFTSTNGAIMEKPNQPAEINLIAFIFIRVFVKYLQLQFVSALTASLSIKLPHPT